MDKTLLSALLAQVWLTFVIALITLKARVNAAKQGKVRLTYFKHNQGDAPETMLRLGDNLKNQFELPVLFYCVILLLILIEQNHPFYLLMAWIFIASRVTHAYIHIKTNHIKQRMISFLIGFIALILMWLGVSVELLT